MFPILEPYVSSALTSLGIPTNALLLEIFVVDRPEPNTLLSGNLNWARGFLFQVRGRKRPRVTLSPIVSRKFCIPIPSPSRFVIPKIKRRVKVAQGVLQSPSSMALFQGSYSQPLSKYSCDLPRLFFLVQTMSKVIQVPKLQR